MHASNKITLENLDNVFVYHNDLTKNAKYQAMREAAKNLAKVILENCPDCADRSAALRQVRESVMSANAGLALALPGEH